jgi:Holliday junction DNA helicase RuvA
MFAYIKGELISSTTFTAILETGGIGYLIYIPVNVSAKLPQMGNQVLLHTSFVVRELSQTLYGFLASQERDLFETLMGVTGIGPKLALSMIGHMPLSDLHRAVSNGDLPKLCKIPGIGKKTAERLIIELRDKLPEVESHSPADLSIQISDPKAHKIRDAMSALINLGYNSATAQKAIKKTIGDFPEEVDLSTLITHSLKNV